jgi:hypothetical protein
LYNREIPNRQLTAWLASAIIPTAIQLTAGASWISVFLVSVLTLLCTWLRWTFGTEPKGKLMVFLQWALLSIVLGSACQAAVQSWPRGGHPAVAIVLLALAVWSAWKGPSAAARVGCVLFWFVLILYLVLLGAGVKDVQLRWLIPTKGDTDPLGCVLLLTPAVAAIHLNKKESFKPRLLMIGLFCTVAAAITVGVLSPQVASTKGNAFYEMTRSLNLLGQARRFEAVLSAGATAGWFSLFALYLTLCGRLAGKIKSEWEQWGTAVAAGSAMLILLCDLHISGVLLLILTAVFWVLLPLLAQGLGTIKKS